MSRGKSSYKPKSKGKRNGPYSKPRSWRDWAGAAGRAVVSGASTYLSNSQKRKHPGGGSNTAKKHKFKGTVSTAHGGRRTGCTMRFSGRKYSPKFMKFITSRQTFGLNSYVTMEAPVGQCTYGWDGILDKNSMNAIYEISDKQKNYELTGPTSFNPVSNNQKDYKVWIMSGSCEYRMANNCHHPIELIIYALKSRKDVQATPIALLESSLGTAGLNSGKLGYTTTLGSSQIGLYPQDSAIYRQYYQVVEQEKITLSPGQTHIYRVYATWNKMMSTAMRFSQGGDVAHSPEPLHYKGYTGGILFRISGYPIHGSGNATEHAKAAVSLSRLDVVAIKRYNYRNVVMSRDHMETVEGQAVFASGGEWYDSASGVMEKVLAGVVSVITDES